jgi:hypothetical protein
VWIGLKLFPWTIGLHGIQEIANWEDIDDSQQPLLDMDALAAHGHAARKERWNDMEGYVGDPLGVGFVIPSKEGYQE